MSATAPKTNGRTRVPRIDVAPEVEPLGLAAALLAFAAEAPKLKRDATGQIQSRTYRYATLDSVLDDVAPLLVKHELVFTAKAILSDGQPAALYKMTHVPSGECDEWIGPLPCVDPGPQNLGSTITYMRRYELVAYLNLAPGDDDDGHGASTGRPPVDRYADAAAAHAQIEARSPSTQPTARPAAPSPRPADAGDKKRIRDAAAAIDLTSEELANIVLHAEGDDRPRSWSDDGAARWLKRELERLPAKHVDAVLAGIGAKS